MVGSAQAPTFYAERGSEWCTALVSVYDALCAGVCPFFYIIKPQVCEVAGVLGM